MKTRERWFPLRLICLFPAKHQQENWWKPHQIGGLSTNAAICFKKGFKNLIWRIAGIAGFLFCALGWDGELKVGRIGVNVLSPLQ